MNMAPTQGFQNPTDNEIRKSREQTMQFPKSEIKVGLLTGGIDRPYVFGLAMALASRGVNLDVIGSDLIDRPELHAPPRLNFLNLRGDQRPNVSLKEKILRVLRYYVRLIHYAWVAKPRVFHILWDNKFLLFDRTVLMLYYKVVGKKIAFTAMNVNAGRRDGNNSLLNRMSLRIQYQLADHIFVHTEKMKCELLEDFGVRMIQPRIDQVRTIVAERTDFPKHDSKRALGRLRTRKHERRTAIDWRPCRSDRQLRVEAARQHGGLRPHAIWNFGHQRLSRRSFACAS